jgi:hypothetical protein
VLLWETAGWVRTPAPTKTPLRWGWENPSLKKMIQSLELQEYKALVVAIPFFSDLILSSLAY